MGLTSLTMPRVALWARACIERGNLEFMKIKRNDLQSIYPPATFGLRAKRVSRVLTGAAIAIAVSVGNLAAFAGDPFRPSSEAREIGDATEAAFVALFREGNYDAAADYVAEALESEARDPMVHAMAASLAYLDGDLDTMLSKAAETKTVAEALMAEDELRGNLYMAVGIFLEGAHALLTEGTVSGTPQALAKLQRVFTHMDRAERIDADDPELNLLKGYMDVMLAVNLPFSDPDDAIANLDAYAAPDYVSQRGIAIAYRDLGEVDQALVAVNKALEAAPQNPDLIYLQGQIYARQGQREESYEAFSKALEFAEQLPDGTVRQLRYEQCLVSPDGTGAACGASLDAGEFDN